MDEEIFHFMFKLVLIGDSSVGKTNILGRYLKNEFKENSKATVGVEFGYKKVTIDDMNIKVQIWDTAGQERYRSITNTYYKGSKGAFVVYDITRKQSFDSVDKWIAELKGSADKNLTITLVGNKVDLESERKVSTELGKEKAKSFGIAFIETSALSGHNLDKAFDTMIREIYNKSKIEMDNNDDDLGEFKPGEGIALAAQKEDKKKCC